MKTKLFILLFFFFTAVTFSAETAKTQISTIDSVAAAVINNNAVPVTEDGTDYGWIVATAIAILETVARLYPTKRNISLIALIIRLINVIIPNIQKRKSKEEPKKFDI